MFGAVRKQHRNSLDGVSKTMHLFCSQAVLLRHPANSVQTACKTATTYKWPCLRTTSFDAFNSSSISVSWMRSHSRNTCSGSAQVTARACTCCPLDKLSFGVYQSSAQGPFVDNSAFHQNVRHPAQDLRTSCQTSVHSMPCVLRSPEFGLGHNFKLNIASNSNRVCSQKLF